MTMHPTNAERTETPRTPRTDAEAEKTAGDFYESGMVEADFARTLETELNAAMAQNEALRGALKKSRDEHASLAKLFRSIDEYENAEYHQKQADEETAALETTPPTKA